MRISDWSSDVCSSDLGGSILSGREQSQVVPPPDQCPNGHLPTQLEIVEHAPVDGAAARKLAKDCAAWKQESACKAMRLILGRPNAGLQPAMHDQMPAPVREIETLAAQALLERTPHNDRPAPIPQKRLMPHSRSEHLPE